MFSCTIQREEVSLPERMGENYGLIDWTHWTEQQLWFSPLISSYSTIEYTIYQYQTVPLSAKDFDV